MGLLSLQDRALFLLFPGAGAIFIFVGVMIRRWRQKKDAFEGRTTGKIVEWHKKTESDDCYYPTVEFDYNHKKFRFEGMQLMYTKPDNKLATTSVSIRFDRNDPTQAAIEDPKADRYLEMYETIALAAGAICLILGLYFLFS